MGEVETSPAEELTDEAGKPMSVVADELILVPPPVGKPISVVELVEDAFLPIDPVEAGEPMELCKNMKTVAIKITARSATRTRC